MFVPNLNIPRQGVPETFTKHNAAGAEAYTGMETFTDSCFIFGVLWHTYIRSVADSDTDAAVTEAYGVNNIKWDNLLAV